MGGGRAGTGKEARKTRVRPIRQAEPVWPLSERGFWSVASRWPAVGDSCCDSNASPGRWAGVEGLLGSLVFIWMWGLTCMALGGW